MARVTVEIRSVNHRYLDLSLRLPRRLTFLENQIRPLVKSYAQRGKVDLTITVEDHALGGAGLFYNEGLARQYVTYMQQISETFSLPNPLTAQAVAGLPEVLVMQEPIQDEEALWEMVKPPLEEACKHFLASREQEGAHLGADLLEKLDLLETLVTKVQERSPQVVEAYQTRLRTKLSEVLSDVSADENRVATELVLFADRICNDEETVRLMSHIQGMKKMITTEDAVGRKLDFLAQEMNREANTILSKSADLEVSNYAIDIKTEIEKIREQVQNLE